MATQAIRPVRHNYSTSGGAPLVDKVNFIGSPLEGELLMRINSCASTCGADPTSISWVALSDSNGVIPGDTTAFQAARVRPSDVFVMNFYHTTAASATLADSDLDQTLQFGIVKATVSSATAWVIDGTDTSATRVTVIERLDPATDTYPRCNVQFMPASCEFV